MSPLVMPSYSLQVLPGGPKEKGYFSSCLTLPVLHSPYVRHAGEWAHWPPIATRYPTVVGRCHQCWVSSLENPLSVCPTWVDGLTGLRPAVSSHQERVVALEGTGWGLELEELCMRPAPQSGSEVCSVQLHPGWCWI